MHASGLRAAFVSQPPLPEVFASLSLSGFRGFLFLATETRANAQKGPPLWEPQNTECATVLFLLLSLRVCLCSLPDAAKQVCLISLCWAMHLQPCVESSSDGLSPVVQCSPTSFFVCWGPRPLQKIKPTSKACGFALATFRVTGCNWEAPLLFRWACDCFPRTQFKLQVRSRCE